MFDRIGDAFDGLTAGVTQQLAGRYEEDDATPEQRDVYDARSDDASEDLSENPGAVYENLLIESDGDIAVESSNPLGGAPIDETVPPAERPELLTFYEDIRDAVPDAEYRLTISYREDDTLEYRLKHDIYWGGGTTFEGQIEGISETEVEPYLSEVIDVDRYNDGWTFDNLEGSIEEFVEPEHTYEVSVDDVRASLINGTIGNHVFVEMGSREIAFTDDDGGLINRLFLEPANPSRPEDLTDEAKAQVEETRGENGFSYTVTIDRPPAEPDVDDALTITLFAEDRLFAPDEEEAHHKYERETDRLTE